MERIKSKSDIKIKRIRYVLDNKFIEVREGSIKHQIIEILMKKNIKRKEIISKFPDKHPITIALDLGYLVKNNFINKDGLDYSINKNVKKNSE